MIEQLKREDLASMSSKEIAKAFREGRCKEITGEIPPLAITIDADTAERLKDDPDAFAEYVAKAHEAARNVEIGSKAWLERAAPQEIRDALNAGELDGLL